MKTIAAAVVAVVGCLACSSIPLMPQEGAGAGLNLATVDYVNATAGELRRQVSRDVLGELPTSLDSALAEDRRRISQLQETVIEHEQELEALIRSLQEAQENLEGASARMREESEAFQKAVDGVRATTEQLEASIAALPTDVLALLREAVDRQLAASRSEASE